MKREIERLPEVPKLKGKVIKLLSELCFRSDDCPKQVDLMFVFGSFSYFETLIEATIKGIKDWRVNKVVVTGGMSKFEDLLDYQHSIAPSKVVVDKLRYDFSYVDFYSETKSTNTRENVREACKVLDFSQFDTLLFVFKCHAAGRGYLTLRNFSLKLKFFNQVMPKFILG